MKSKKLSRHLDWIRSLPGRYQCCLREHVAKGKLVNRDNIVRIWRESDDETRKEIMDWFASESLQATSDVADFPFQWVDFIRLCAFDGLMGSLKRPWYLRLIDSVRAFASIK